MNVRPSNTEPLLRLNLEALDPRAHGAQARRGPRRHLRLGLPEREGGAEAPPSL